MTLFNFAVCIPRLYCPLGKNFEYSGWSLELDERDGTTDIRCWL